MDTLPRGSLHQVALFLDGSRVGDVGGIEGLQMEAEVVTNDLGPDLSTKHVGAIGWTPAQLRVGMGMGEACAAWIHGALARRALKLSGEVAVIGARGRVQSGVVFMGATITGFTVPALEKPGREPAALLVEFDVEQLRIIQGDGRDIGSPAGVSMPWLRSGFRIEIGSLPCANVARIEALTWTVVADAGAAGSLPMPTLHPGRVALTDLQLSIASADFAAWSAAATRWFVDGAHQDSDEMSGCITLLGSDGVELAALTLSGVGFRRFPGLDLQADGRFDVTLYIEAMSFELRH